MLELVEIPLWLGFVETPLWYLTTLICWILFVVFILQYKKRENVTRPFFLGLSIFSLGFGLARLIETIRRYSVGTYNDIIDSWHLGIPIIGLNFWLRILYYAIAWASIATLYFNIEKFVFKRKKFILTASSIAEGALSISIYFYFNQVAYWASVVLFLICGYFIPLLFLNLARTTPPSAIRNGCVAIAIGMLLFVTGVMIDLPEATYFMNALEQTAPELVIRISAPILVISGLLLFSLGFKRFFPKE